MGKNIEIKARIDSIAALLPAVKKIATSGPQEILQDDTFFPCANGRLKLRAATAEENVLVFYKREDKTGPKENSYIIAKVPEPDIMRELLAKAYGVSGRVKKRRILYMVGNTRVHLDNVEGLGEFLELEVVLSGNETSEDGIKIANSIMDKLGIAKEQLIDCAYVDLLEQGRAKCA